MKATYHAFYRDPTGYGEAGRRMLGALRLVPDLDLRPGAILTDGGWRTQDTTVEEFLAQPPHAKPDLHLINARRATTRGWSAPASVSA